MIDLLSYKIGKSAGSGLPDPSSYSDGTVLVKVGDEWKAQRGYGYESEAAFEPIEWDGETEGHETVEHPLVGSLVRIRDTPLTMSDVIGSTAKISNAMTFQVASEYIDDYGQGAFSFAAICFFIPYDNFDLAGTEIPHKGVWAVPSGAFSSYYLASLTASSSVQTIDPKFIPQSGDELIVKFSFYDDNYYDADKTADEIAEAMSSGKRVLGYETTENKWYDILVAEDDYPWFERVAYYFEDNALEVERLSFADEFGRWHKDSKSYTLTANS